MQQLRSIMKATFISILLLVAISCEAMGLLSLKDRLKNRILRGSRKATPAPTKKVEIKAVNHKTKYDLAELKKINSTRMFYEYFNISHSGARPNGRPSGSGDHSTAVEHDGSVWNCGVRLTLVSLPSPGFGNGHVFPPCVLLKRCTGCCFLRNLMTCKPQKRKMTTVDYVYVYSPTGHPADTTHRFESTLMEEHLECECECIKTPDSCDPERQTWDPNTCECSCRPAYQESELKCPKPYYKFDKGTCQCVCNVGKDDCPPHKKWSQSECGCVCKRDSCSGRHEYVHRDTCQCVKLGPGN